MPNRCVEPDQFTAEKLRPLWFVVQNQAGEHFGSLPTNMQNVRHKGVMVAKTAGGVDLAEISIFSELSKRELKAVSRLMTELPIKEGATLTRQGEPGREFMIISSGTAKVQIDGETVAHLASGDFLGELAVISGTPRTATVIATSDMVVEILNRREFMALLDESANLGRKILVGAVKRLQINERSKTN